MAALPLISTKPTKRRRCRACSRCLRLKSSPPPPCTPSPCSRGCTTTRPSPTAAPFGSRDFSKWHKSKFLFKFSHPPSFQITFFLEIILFSLFFFLQREALRPVLGRPHLNGEESVRGVLCVQHVRPHDALLRRGLGRRAPLIRPHTLLGKRRPDGGLGAGRADHAALAGPGHRHA